MGPIAKPKNDEPVRFRAVSPELPQVDAWRPYLPRAYEANWFTNFGEVSRSLEDRLHQAWGFEQSTFVATSSGTAAIAACLIAKEITGPVLTPAFTFPATAAAIRMAAAEPIVIDVDLSDWRISPQGFERALLESKASAAVLVCPFGFNADHRDHIRIAEKHGATLVIDNAAGLGVPREPIENAEMAFEVYSLHATKPFGIGEGGLIVANKKHDTALRRALNFGLPLDAGPPSWGINGKMSEFHAAIGHAAFDEFPDRLASRQNLASRYQQALAKFPGIVFEEDAARCPWQVFPVLAPSTTIADAFVRIAGERRMELRRYYRPSLSKWPGLTVPDACPVSEGLANRMCCLPITSYADESEIDAMINIAVQSMHEALETPNV